MTLQERLRRAIDGIPEGGSIALPVCVVEQWLSDGGLDVEPDLTVEDVAELFGRSPTTVRTWIREGRLEAYRFGREYRITRRALAEFQQRERGRRQ